MYVQWNGTLLVPPIISVHSNNKKRRMMKLVSFLLKGHVQGVKMRRYVESAGQYFGLGGYVINIDEGDPHDPGAVFGQAWGVIDVIEVAEESPETESRFDSFVRWIQGEWTPCVYTNIKPTPIGTAYPEKAHVEGYALMVSSLTHPEPKDKYDPKEEFNQFTMVRGDEDASRISEATREIRQRLSLAMVGGGGGGDLADADIAIGSWPSRR